MCGLVGVVGNIGIQEKKVFRNLLHLDVKRGEDSTGIAAINRENDVSLYKEAGVPWDLYRSQPENFDKKDHIVTKYNLKALIGHNRYATVGKVNGDNAHPFKHGKIVGAHNGTLNQTYLNKLDGVGQFEVDSEAVFYGFDKNGVEDTVGRMNGAWALSWYNSEENTMNFLRNTMRPLYYCWSKLGDSFYWSSQPDILEVSLAWENVHHEDIHQFDINKHYSITLGTPEEIRKVALVYEVEPVLGFTPPVVTTSYSSHYGTSYQGGQPQSNQNVKVVEAAGKRFKELMRMQDLIGKEIQFFIKGEKHSKSKIPYLSAESNHVNDHFEIRIYSAGRPRHEEWKKSTGYYTGKIKKVVTNYTEADGFEDYALLDMRTISEKEIPWDDGYSQYEADEPVLSYVPLTPETNNGLFKGFNSEHLTYDEFKLATKNGCSWCTTDVDGSTYNKIHFISKDEHICDKCFQDPDIKMYYSHFMY